MRKELGKLLLDFAKIIFGTAFLGAILTDSINKVLLGIVSFVVIVIFSILGLYLIKKS
ncbi:MAG: DUF6722 family protein [Tangfeifania sp.]